VYLGGIWRSEGSTGSEAAFCFGFGGGCPGADNRECHWRTVIAAFGDYLAPNAGPGWAEPVASGRLAFCGAGMLLAEGQWVITEQVCGGAWVGP